MYPIDELIGRFKYELNNYQDLEKNRINICNKVKKYFNSTTITHYFLWNIKNKFK